MNVSSSHYMNEKKFTHKQASAGKVIAAYFSFHVECMSVPKSDTKRFFFFSSCSSFYFNCSLLFLCSAKRNMNIFFCVWNGARNEMRNKNLEKCLGEYMRKNILFKNGEEAKIIHDRINIYLLLYLLRYGFRLTTNNFGYSNSIVLLLLPCCCCYCCCSYIFM